MFDATPVALRVFLKSGIKKSNYSGSLFKNNANFNSYVLEVSDVGLQIIFTLT